MPDFNFEMTLSADPKKLFELVTNYENYQEVFPDQLKNVSIVSRNDFEVITKEVLTFNTYFKNTNRLNVQFHCRNTNIVL